jgi:hypothetical protein
MEANDRRLCGLGKGHDSYWKIEELKRRLKPDRPKKTVILRLPEDVIDDLKRVALIRGISGYEPLMRVYIGQGLCADLEKLDRES